MPNVAQNTSKNDLSDKKILCILKDSPLIKEEQARQELRQKRAEAGQKRIRLLQERESFFKESNKLLAEVEDELKRAFKAYQAAKTNRGVILSTQIGQMSNYDTQIGELEHFLKQTRPPLFDEQIELLKAEKQRIANSLRLESSEDWRQAMEGDPRFRVRRVKLGSNLPDIEASIKDIDGRIQSIKERNLAGCDGEELVQ